MKLQEKLKFIYENLPHCFSEVEIMEIENFELVSIEHLYKVTEKRMNELCEFYDKREMEDYNYNKEYNY